MLLRRIHDQPPSRRRVHKPTQEVLSWWSATPTDFCGISDENLKNEWIELMRVFVIRRHPVTVTNHGDSAIPPQPKSSMKPIDLTPFRDNASGFFRFEITF
jgi:hypothetical protein